MATSASIDPARDQLPPAVELRVKAHPDQLAVLRAVTSAIALQHDFDLDTVADVKLAVDEAATRLIMGSPADGTLSCSFRVMYPMVHVRLSAPTVDADAVGQPRSFGWHVLNSLTESISVSADDSVATIDMSIAEGSAAR